MYSGILFDMILTSVIGIMLILMGNGRIRIHKNEEAREAFKKKHGRLLIVSGAVILLATIAKFILWDTEK